MSWLLADLKRTVYPTSHIVVTCQLKVERRTGSVRRPKTGVPSTVLRNKPREHLMKCCVGNTVYNWGNWSIDNDGDEVFVTDRSAESDPWDGERWFDERPAEVRLWILRRHCSVGRRNHHTPGILSITVAVHSGFSVILRVFMNWAGACAFSVARAWNLCVSYIRDKHPSLPLDNIRVMVIVWTLRVNIIRTAPCWVVWHNVHSQQHTHMSSSYRSSRFGLSHWDPYAMHRGGCLALYYCNTVEWSWLDSSLIWKTSWFPSVLWHC